MTSLGLGFSLPPSSSFRCWLQSQAPHDGWQDGSSILSLLGSDPVRMKMSIFFIVKNIIFISLVFEVSGIKCVNQLQPPFYIPKAEM